MIEQVKSKTIDSRQDEFQYKITQQLAKSIDQIYTLFNQDLLGTLNLNQFKLFFNSFSDVIYYPWSKNQSFNQSKTISNIPFPAIETNLNLFFKFFKIQGRYHYLKQIEKLQIQITQLESEYNYNQLNSKDKNQIDKLQLYCFFKYGLGSFFQYVQKQKTGDKLIK